MIRGRKMGKSSMMLLSIRRWILGCETFHRMRDREKGDERVEAPTNQAD